jgi:hypothetical protein
MAFRIKPTIVPGEFMVTEDSDPSVANIVFDGTYEDCASYLRDHDPDFPNRNYAEGVCAAWNANRFI